MNFDWLKRFMPRGLYGRAALILIMPILTLQLVVSVVFIQRHYEGVTRQMTRSLVLDLDLLRDEIDTSADMIGATARLARLSDPLRLAATLLAADPAHGDTRNFWDLSGRALIETLHESVDGVRAIDLKSDKRRLKLWLQTKYGVATISVSRDRVTASNPHQLLVLMAFVGVLMTFVAFLYLRNQLRPIKRLARAAESFGHGQIVEYRPSGANEVRSAGRAFLDMRGRIERHIEQRTMMLSSVSHDLRTPLTRFKLAVSMMPDTAEKTELDQDISDMERLLDSFLAFARGDALDDMEWSDPTQLVQDVVDRCARDGSDVSIGELSDDAQTMLRPMAIARVLENLISNALRYGTKAVVDVNAGSRSIRISVSDNGPGIAPKSREQALKPFARLDSARNQDLGSGVGLGLAISNDIARRHGGKLRLGDSEQLGGLRVDLILPRKLSE